MNFRRVTSETLKDANVVGRLPIHEYGVRRADAEALLIRLTSALEGLAYAIESEEIVDTGFTWPALNKAIDHLRKEHSSGDCFLTCPIFSALVGKLDITFEGMSSEIVPADEIETLKKVWEQCKGTYKIYPTLVDTFTVVLEGCQEDVNAAREALQKAVVRILRHEQRKLAVRYNYQESSESGLKFLIRKDLDNDKIELARCQ